MKRVPVAIALLILVCIGCFVSLHFETKILEDLIDLTKNMENAYLEGDEETALQFAEQLAREFPQKTRGFHFVLHHNEITEIEKTAVSLPLVLKVGERENFPVVTRECRLLLERFLALQKPNLENIF